MDEDLYTYGPVKRVLSCCSGIADGVAALLAFCKERHPDPVWDEMAKLDYSVDGDAMRTWVAGQLPIPEAVQVVWFAPWDIAEGFDLRGASSWSRDPEDWEWWYHDDFQGGGFRSPVLSTMLEMATEADKAKNAAEDVYDLTLWVLSIGYLSLAATGIMRSLAVDVLGDRAELWAVTGFPDAVYGIILGRLTLDGFDPFEHPR